MLDICRLAPMSVASSATLPLFAVTISTLKATTDQVPGITARARRPWRMSVGQRDKMAIQRALAGFLWHA
jgi:hypothetical protein